MNPLVTFAFVTILLVSCQSRQVTPALSSATYDGVRWISAFDQRDSFLRLEKEIERADFEFHLDGEEILLSQSKKYADFALPSLGDPLSRDSRFEDAFVVVQLRKLAQMEQVEKKVVRINAYFFFNGAKRVLVTGFRGSGRSIYSDKSVDSK